eukprot:8808317-Pyramimonas_sp.AAC.1
MQATPQFLRFGIGKPKEAMSKTIGFCRAKFGMAFLPSPQQAIPEFLEVGRGSPKETMSTNTTKR